MFHHAARENWKFPFVISFLPSSWLITYYFSQSSSFYPFQIIPSTSHHKVSSSLSPFPLLVLALLLPYPIPAFYSFSLPSFCLLYVAFCHHSLWLPHSFDLLPTAWMYLLLSLVYLPSSYQYQRLASSYLHLTWSSSPPSYSSTLVSRISVPFSCWVQIQHLMAL